VGLHSTFKNSKLFEVYCASDDQFCRQNF